MSASPSLPHTIHWVGPTWSWALRFLAALVDADLLQTSKRRFSGFLSRLGTASSSTSAVDFQDDDGQIGRLGLTTLCKSPHPLAPVAHLVFIHGLGGGSRKTWSFSDDPNHYWPQAWLPVDRDFEHVCIHTFGYNSDWGDRRQSVSSVDGIAQSLVEALRNDPGMRQTDTTRIVLIGHSMGGLVAKTAYTVAMSDPDPKTKAFADRVHSIFFLATPHRGSTLAGTLDNVLAAPGWGKKSYVADLMPDSPSLAMINNQFRKFAPRLKLWSFRETLSTKRAGFLNQLVVKLDSASLGFPSEAVVNMDADHRHVCKFKSPDDPNYKLLRNALQEAVSMIRESMTTSTSPLASLATFPMAAVPMSSPTTTPRTVPMASPTPSHSVDNESGAIGRRAEPSLSPELVKSVLLSFLDVDETFVGDLQNHQDKKEPGSCRWFTDQTSFESWQAGKAPGIRWLFGRPGAGKSIISGHVIDCLTTPSQCCSYFIFKQSNTTWSECFRSIAFQMAIQDGLVSDALLQLHREGSAWDKTDETSVWRRLFTGCIFKLPSLARHVWVVDGVDECAGFAALFTERLVVAVPKELRLFATSRPLAEIERGLKALGPDRVSTQSISDANTAPDMRLFVEAQLAHRERLEYMCEEILRRASGSFLWVYFVVQQLQHIPTVREMEEALSLIPTRLPKFYSSMVQTIEADQRGVPLARSILTWVVLARRPLTVDELKCAVMLDTLEELMDAARAIPNLCAHLVFVDSNDRVQVIHDTVRQFFVEGRHSGFHVHNAEGHARLASLLLRYLGSGVFGSTIQPPAPPPILEYACASFSEHLDEAAPSDVVLADLSTFFNGSVLFWIEHHARKGDLTPIIQAANSIRKYLAKCAPGADAVSGSINGWSTELVRVAAKFRPQLLTCPSSIHHLIPPLCPSESLIARTFGIGRPPQWPTSSRLTVKGLRPGAWEDDDCLIQMEFQKDITSAVAHGIRVFAIGMISGTVSLYGAISLQVLRKLKMPGRVYHLQFGPSDSLLAACGSTRLVIWDPITGIALHSFDLQSNTWALAFVGADTVVTVSNFCERTTWYVKSTP